MAPTLPDDADAWADRLQTAVNGSDEFREAAAGFDATFRFDVLPDDASDGQPEFFTVVVRDGTCVASRGVDTDAAYDFVLGGPYLAWRDLLRDEIDVSAAVTGGRFELEGSKMELLNHRDAVAALVRAAQSVETEFAY